MRQKVELKSKYGNLKNIRVLAEVTEDGEYLISAATYKRISQHGAGDYYPAGVAYAGYVDIAPAIVAP
jgi:hypothetical protein